jgi:hypothetical protein
MRNAYNIFVGKAEGKNHSEDLGIDGRLILQCIRMDCTGLGWDAFGSYYGPLTDPCEHGNEISASIKGDGFLD